MAAIEGKHIPFSVLAISKARQSALGVTNVLFLRLFAMSFPTLQSIENTVLKL